MSYSYPQGVPTQGYSGYNGFKPQVPQYSSNNWSAIAQVRPVSSIEEVKAYPIDFDGSVFYFPDVANKRIYTKQINPDGSATLNVYEQREMPLGNLGGNNFITREEFETVIEQLRTSLTPPPQVHPKKDEFLQF